MLVLKVLGIGGRSLINIKNTLSSFENMTGMGVEPTELEVIPLSRVLATLHYDRIFFVNRIRTFLTYSEEREA